MLGKIYKIIHNQSNIIYVGSTNNTLRQRWQEHKRHFTNEKSRKLSIHEYFERYGIDNFKIILIKEYEVIDRKHLEAYEQLWISKLKAINKQNLLLPKFIRLEEMKKRNKSDEYKIKKNERSKKDYNENKDKYSDKARKYYEKNKDILKTKIKCECGGSYSKTNKSTHFKTAKHLKYNI